MTSSLEPVFIPEVMAEIKLGAFDRHLKCEIGSETFMQAPNSLYLRT